ncbi:MAG: chorismate synthase [Clostridia bacterium]|nr:chorismate synthase [Clostridia bacterium]MDD4048544.1 chorismate synthase [Clostridia bacterium]
MSSNFGNSVKISIFGQSHSEGIGVVIDGLPAGERLDFDSILAFMSRRAPGKSNLATSRKESDLPKILSGIIDGVTCGAPLTAVIYNNDVRSADYDDLKEKPRPSHADYTAKIKYNGFNDIRGGGHFSGRLTAPLCFAGAVCNQILTRRGIHIGGHIAAVGGVLDDCFDPVNVDKDELLKISGKEFSVINDDKGNKMKETIRLANLEHDSVGGIVEVVAVGLPVGLGNPIFDGVENRIAAAMFGIPGVKGIEFGAGFQSASMKGSNCNDEFIFDGEKIVTTTNNHGGILGGITSGMPIVVRVAFKPTPSIGKEQQTVNMSKNITETLTIKGRHDPCIVGRAVPCVEAVLAITILDILSE